MLSIVFRVSILTLFCLYSVFKIIEIWPTHILLASTLALVYFFLMNAWLFIYRVKPALIDQPWFIAFSWSGSTAMGLWATFILLSIPFDLGLLGYYLLGTFHILPFAMQRFFVWARYVDLIIIGLSFAIVLLGFIEVIRGPMVRRISLVIPGLPQALDQFKIAQLSDLHIGTMIRQSYIEKVVRRTNAVTPNMVMLTGDIADAKAHDILAALRPLADLIAPQGKFYVTGNHEYYWDALGLMAAISQCGFTVLTNENRIVKVESAKILVGGITDAIGGNFLPGHRPNVNNAIATVENSDFKILLSHRPEYCTEAEKLGFDLQFSGHTHGGQFFPFNFIVALVHQYYRRLNKHGRLWLYVNPGTGYWGPANRFGVPAEITLLTLYSSS